MARNSAPGQARTAVAVLGWVLAATGVQGLLRPELGASVRRLHESIEQHLESAPAAPVTPAPTRSHDADAIEPWELVEV